MQARSVQLAHINYRQVGRLRVHNYAEPAQIQQLEHKSGDNFGKKGYQFN